MFQVSIEFNHFQQLTAVNPDLSDAMVGLVSAHAQDYGASFRTLGTGHFNLGFKLQKHSDTAFIMEGLMGLKTRIDLQVQELYGYYILVEDAGDDEEGYRVLRRLALSIRETAGIWIGPGVRGELESFLLTVRQGELHRVQDMKDKPGTDYSQIHENFLLSPELKRMVQILRFEADRRIPRNRGVAFISNDDPECSDLVQEAIMGLVDQKRDLFWIPGQDVNDPAAFALMRGVFPQDLDSIEKHVRPEDRELWELSRNFLFQTSFCPVKGMKLAAIPPQDPVKVFRIAFDIFFRALGRRNSERGKALIIHVERFSLLNTEAQACITGLMALDDSRLETQGIMWVFSGVQSEDIPPGLREHSIHHIKGSSPAELSRLGLSAPGYPGIFAPLRNSESLGYRLYLILAFLEKIRPATTGAALPESGAGLSAFGARKLVLRELLAALDPILVEMLYVCAISYGFLSLDELTLFFESLSIERIRVPGFIRQLRMLGLIRDEELCLPTYPGTIEIIEYLLDDAADQIREGLCNHLSARIESKAIPLRMDLVILLKELGSLDVFFRLLDRYTRSCLDSGDLSSVDLMIGHASHALKEIQDPEALRVYESMVTYLHARATMESGEMDRVRRLFSSLEQESGPDSHPGNGYLHILKGRMLFLLDGIDAALPWIKRGIMDFQESGESKGLSDAQRMFGHILFAKERLFEARDYFVLARNNAADQKLASEELWAALHESQVNFILGYYSRVLGDTDQGSFEYHKALESGKFGMAEYQLFLRGRSFFEIGMYTKAMESWESCRALAELIDEPQPLATLRRWISRARIYLGHPEEVLSVLGSDESPEARLFLMEAYHFMDQPGKVCELAEGYQWPVAVLHLPEKIDWTSGFAFLEDRLYPEADGSMMGLMAWILKTHASGLVAETERCCQELSRFTRNLKKNSVDPCVYWYLYLQSDLLSHVPHNQGEDRATVLGKAVKYYQERAARIENPLHKKSFMKENLWNRILLGDAKKFNLA